MQRRRRLACITPRPYFLSGASAIFAVAGLRSKPIPRFDHPTSSSLFTAKFNFNLIFLQNTRYVVVSGARRKEEDWDPAENGGFAVLGTHLSLLLLLFLI
jgi:hypothetical protein